MFRFSNDVVGDDPDDLPLSVSDPNAFRYRDFGYVDARDDTVLYVSTSGRTKVRAEVYRLFENDGEAAPCNRKYRMKVECDDETWVTVHSGATAVGAGRLTEMTVGLPDGTVVAITRSPEPVFGFDVTGRTVDGRTADDRLTEMPLLECDGSVATVTLADGSRVVAEYADPGTFVCEASVADGTRVRMLADPTVQYFQRDGSPEVVTRAVDAKYLVCRRDLSGYEFVDSNVQDQPSTSRGTDRFSDDSVTVVRPLTRSHFDGTTSGLLDSALSVHLKSICELADRLNANLSDSSLPLVTDT